MITLALLAALVVPPDTWTVDDDGPADFTQIAEAVSQVAPGDVLLVEPGEYAPFDLTQRLTIVSGTGPSSPHLYEQPHVLGLSRVVGDGFTIAGINFDALRVVGVSGRGRIDDCHVGYEGDAKQAYALDVDGCAQLVVSRTRVRGSEDYSDSHFYFGGAAMQIRTSNVTVVDCHLRGASGFDAGDFGGYGGTALSVSDSSRAVIVTTSMVGGLEGYGYGISCTDGPSGTGLKVSSSQVVVRGVPLYNDYIVAGFVDGICRDIKGPAIDISQGVVVISGTSFDADNVKLQGGTLLELADPEPLLMIAGTDFPGGQRDVQIHGPAGAACMLVVSLAPLYAPLETFDDVLWVGLSGPYLLVPLVTTGQDTPVKLSWTVPQSTVGLVGLSVEMQPFFPGIASALDPGKSLAGNVAELIVRF